MNHLIVSSSILMIEIYIFSILLDFLHINYLVA